MLHRRRFTEGSSTGERKILSRPSKRSRHRRFKNGGTARRMTDVFIAWRSLDDGEMGAEGGIVSELSMVPALLSVHPRHPRGLSGLQHAAEKRKGVLSLYKTHICDPYVYPWTESPSRVSPSRLRLGALCLL